MRQYKAKTKNSNEWVYGDRVKGASGKVYIFDYDDINHSDYGIHEVNPDTVCQFTGWYEMDNKKVYEGDILEYGHRGGGGLFEVEIKHEISTKSETYGHGSNGYSEFSGFRNDGYFGSVKNLKFKRNIHD